MPTNLYGPGDNYHPTNSHVIPALLRKFHEAKQRKEPEVTVWGTGTPRREFLYSDDMADACVFLMNLPEDRYAALLGSDEVASGRFEPPLVNIGVGTDVTIAELAAVVAKVVGYTGGIVYDTSKPDGTPRKLMDVGLVSSVGWQAHTALEDGLRVAYAEFAGSLPAQPR
jgi:GDP-L-fucose synthase